LVPPRPPSPLFFWPLFFGPPSLAPPLSAGEHPLWAPCPFGGGPKNFKPKKGVGPQPGLFWGGGPPFYPPRGNGIYLKPFFCTRKKFSFFSSPPPQKIPIKNQIFPPCKFFFPPCLWQAPPISTPNFLGPFSQIPNKNPLEIGKIFFFNSCFLFGNQKLKGPGGPPQKPEMGGGFFFWGPPRKKNLF